MIRFALLAFLGLGTLVSSGCGIRGDLDRPPPLWGADMADPMTDSAEADADDLPEPDGLDEENPDEDAPGYGIDVAE